MTLGNSLWIGRPEQWNQRMNLTCQNEEKWTAGQLESGEDDSGDHHCDDLDSGLIQNDVLYWNADSAILGCHGNDGDLENDNGGILVGNDDEILNAHDAEDGQTLDWNGDGNLNGNNGGILEIRGDGNDQVQQAGFHDFLRGNCLGEIPEDHDHCGGGVLNGKGVLQDVMRCDLGILNVRQDDFHNDGLN